MAEPGLTGRDAAGFGTLDRMAHRRIMEVLSNADGDRAALMELMLLLDSSKELLGHRLRELESAGLIVRRDPMGPHGHFFQELLAYDISGSHARSTGAPEDRTGVPFEASRLIPLVG